MKVTLADHLDFSREVARASTKRDRRIRALGIDERLIDPWAYIGLTGPTAKDRSGREETDGDDESRIGRGSTV